MKAFGAGPSAGTSGCAHKEGVMGLTPELSRAAKQRRLGRIVSAHTVWVEARRSCTAGAPDDHSLA